MFLYRGNHQECLISAPFTFEDVAEMYLHKHKIYFPPDDLKTAGFVTVVTCEKSVVKLTMCKERQEEK